MSKTKEKWGQIIQGKMPRRVLTFILSIVMLLTMLPIANVFAVAVTQLKKVDLPVYLGSATGISDYMHVYVMRDPDTGDPVYCTRKGATLPSNSFALTEDDINNNPLLFYRLKSIYDNGNGWRTSGFARTTPNVNGVDYSGASTYFGFITNQIAIWMVLGEMGYQSGSLLGGTYGGKDIYEAYTSGEIATMGTTEYNSEWTLSQNISDSTARNARQSYLNDVHNANTILYAAKQIADTALAKDGSYTMNPILCTATIADKTDWTDNGDGTYTATVTANVDNDGTWTIMAGDYTNCSVSPKSGASGETITVTATAAQKQAGAHIRVRAVAPKDDASASVLSFFTSNGQSFVTLTNGHVPNKDSPADVDWLGDSGPTPSPGPTAPPAPTGHGTINIYKSKYALSNPSGTMAPEAGAMFAVYDDSGSIVDTLTTDASGNASSSSEYDMGSYTISQIFSPANYFTFLMGNTWSFTVGEGEGQSFSYSASNIIYEQYIRVLKTDSETGAVVRLAGATFEVLAADGVTVLADSNGNTEFTTDATGTIALPDLPLVVGNYYIKEIQAPRGYVLNENLYSFSVSIFEHGTSAVTVENSKDVKNIYFADKPQKCEIQITKMGDYLLTAEKAAATDSKGITLTDDKNNPLSFFTYTYMAKEKFAANFEVYVGEKDIVDQDGNPKKYDVDKDGIAETPMLAGTDLGAIRLQELDRHVMTNLPLDGITATAEYVVKETMAPFGDLLEGAMTWNFTYADQHIDIIVNHQNVYDTRQRLQVKIQKLKEAGIWNASKNDYDWLYVPAEGITFGLYTKDAVTGDLGALMIPPDTLVDVMVTDANGYAVSTQDITFGNYYIKELKATPDVRLDSKAYDVSAMPVDQTSAVGVVTTTGLTQPIINDAVAGKVNIYKVAADTKLPMPGVVFEVYDKDGTLVDTVKTDETGHAKTKVLPYGQYTLVETKTITGYALSDKQTININISQLIQHDGEDFSEADVVIADQKMAQVDVYKVTGDGKQTPMNGVVFGVYDAKTDKEVARITTDKDGYGSVYIMAGDYYMKEIKTWDGYALSADKISIAAEFAHIYTYHETNSLTELRVLKTSTGGTPLSGMRFTVTETSTGRLISFVYDAEKKAYVASYVFGAVQEMSAQTASKALSSALTGKNGMALILGLMPGTYTITETGAPSGYNKDAMPVDIEISDANNSEKANNSKTNADVIIEDSPTFPKTGETDGNIDLTKISICCLVMALITIVDLFLRKRRT